MYAESITLHTMLEFFFLSVILHPFYTECYFAPSLFCINQSHKIFLHIHLLFLKSQISAIKFCHFNIHQYGDAECTSLLLPYMPKNDNWFQPFNCYYVVWRICVLSHHRSFLKSIWWLTFLNTLWSLYRLYELYVYDLKLLICFFRDKLYII